MRGFLVVSSCSPAKHSAALHDCMLTEGRYEPVLTADHLCGYRGLSCHLQARGIAEGIIATVSLMSKSGLPCYGRGHPLENLKKRFHLEMSDSQAAAFMRNTVHDAYDKVLSFTYSRDRLHEGCSCLQLMPCQTSGVCLRSCILTFFQVHHWASQEGW